MGEELLRAIPVYFFSMLKFILGPSLGFAAKLHFITTLIVTVGGMMTMVFAFTYSGEWIKEKIIHRFFKKRKLTPPNRRFAAIWTKYGLTGIAFLTPIILTPIGGTLLAVSSGSPREKIILYMFFSAVTWGLIFTGIIYFVGDKALPDFVRP
jgi:membrane protein DedA with SNARE-associated domain